MLAQCTTQDDWHQILHYATHRRACRRSALHATATDSGLCPGHAQAKRLQNFKTKGETGLLGMAPFDPLGLRDDYRRQSEVRCCV